MRIKPGYVALLLGVLIVLVLAISLKQHSSPASAPATAPTFPMQLNNDIGPGTTK